MVDNMVKRTVLFPEFPGSTSADGPTDQDGGSYGALDLLRRWQATTFGGSAGGHGRKMSETTTRDTPLVVGHAGLLRPTMRKSGEVPEDRGQHGDYGNLFDRQLAHQQHSSCATAAGLGPENQLMTPIGGGNYRNTCQISNALPIVIGRSAEAALRSAAV